VIAVLFGIAVIVLLLATFPMEMLVGLSFLYLASVPLAMRRFRKYEKADAAAATVEAKEPSEPVPDIRH
jgi:CDP-diacylglycerol--serine O-phosphatidyltransferase